MIHWSTYNRQLVKRGKILVSKDLFESEPEEAKKRLCHQTQLLGQLDTV